MKPTKEMIQIYFTDLLGSISERELTTNIKFINKSKRILNLLQLKEGVS